MKKLLILALALTTTFSAFAQSRGVTRVETRDGRSIIRISVNENDRDQNRRIRDLEEAVRDLQDQVYDLSRTPRVRTEIQYVCSVRNSMTKRIYTERALTRLEAESAAKNACRSSADSFFCDSSATCQQTTVEVRY